MADDTAGNKRDASSWVASLLLQKEPELRSRINGLQWSALLLWFAHGQVDPG